MIALVWAIVVASAAGEAVEWVLQFVLLVVFVLVAFVAGIGVLLVRRRRYSAVDTDEREVGDDYDDDGSRSSPDDHGSPF